MTRSKLSRIALPAAAMVVLAAAGAFGPPHVTVTEVTGAPPTPNAVLEVVAVSHPDHGVPELSARVLTLHSGTSVSNPIRVNAASQPGRFGIARQWEAGAPALVVVTLRQGDAAAEALVRVNAQGRITGITHAIGTNLLRDRFPRAFTNAELDEALRAM